MRNNLTKIFAVMAMSVMSIGMWAIDIPQAAVGDYIAIGTVTKAGSETTRTTAAGVTLTKCQVDGTLKEDGSLTSYTIGSTGAQTQIEFALNATEAGDYLFSFMSGSDGYTAKLSLSLKNNSSSEEIWSGTADIINTGAWALTTRHLFAVGNLSADSYTMTIKVTERAQDGGTGNYAGNFGNFCFNVSGLYPWPSSSALDLQYGTFQNAQWGSENKDVYNIRAVGASVDNIIAYNTTESFYKFCFNIIYFKQNSKVGITITDIATGNVEISNQTLEITANGDKLIRLYKSLAAGWKKIRFDFTDNDPIDENAYLYNFKAVTLPAVSYDALPVESALDLEHGTYDHANWNSDNVINYIKAVGASIDDLYVNNVSEGFYKFCFTIEYIKQNSKVGITITDVETGNVEINNQTLEITANGNKEMRLASPLTVGLKKIRFDFTDNDPVNTDEHLFNFKTVTFPAVTYDAMPLTDDDATLNLNQAGCIFSNCKYELENSNIGFIKNGGYADNYFIYNSIPTAHFTLDAGIPWCKNGGTFKITITDVATGNVEVNAQESPAITGTGDVHFDITNAITHGLKKIRFDFVKAGESDYLFNLNNISFTAVKYTRSHPHMNLNTLCYPYQIDSYTGATFYTILRTEVDGSGNLTDLWLEEHEGALQAGVPYFYDPTEGADELVCYYSGAEQATPQTAANGAFVGAYADDTAIPEGSYVTVNNQLYKTGTGATMGEYRAYVTATAYSRAAIPGRKVRQITNEPAVATGIESIQPSELSAQKVLRNGQLYLMYEGRMYDVRGQVINR